MLIYGGIAYTWGTGGALMKSVEGHLAYSGVGHQMGLKDGDVLYAIDGKEIKYFEAP